MKVSNTSERLRYIMEERNIKQVDILRLAKPYCDKEGVKLGRNDLSQYVHGKVEPKQDKLSILGLALNVSETWLMGYDVPMEQSPSPVDLKTDAESIGRRILKLSPEKRARILERLQVFEEEEEAAHDAQE